MEVVTEREHPPRARLADRQRQALQRLAAVVRRQQLAVLRVEARLFEVQIGDQQRFLSRPVDRAFGRCDECFACERKGNHDPRLDERR